MNSNRTTLIIASVMFAGAVVIAALAIRGGLRYYALNRVLNFPQAQARLAVKPTKRTLSDRTPVQLVNLGYATFDTGTTNHLFIESTSSGAAIIVTNRDVSMAFLSPFAPKKSVNQASSRVSEREARAKPNTLARMKEWETDLIVAEMSFEEAQPLPPSKIFLMNSDDFLLYSLKAALKAGNRIGSKSVEFIQSSYTKGIVRIGENMNDSRFAMVCFASLDGTKNIGLHLRLTGPSCTNLFDYLDPVLRSFRFTVASVDDGNAVKALIRDAGIQQQK